MSSKIDLCNYRLELHNYQSIPPNKFIMPTGTLYKKIKYKPQKNIEINNNTLFGIVTKLKK